MKAFLWVVEELSFGQWVPFGSGMNVVNYAYSRSKARMLQRRFKEWDPEMPTRIRKYTRS